MGLRSEVTDSFKELVKTLKGRLGGANQSDKFRMEIRNRRRKDEESLQRPALRRPTISCISLPPLTALSTGNDCL